MVAIAQNPSVWFQGTEQQPCQFLKAGSTLAWFQNQKVIRPLARERPDLATAKASQAKLDRARSGQRPPGNRWCNNRTKNPHALAIRCGRPVNSRKQRLVQKSEISGRIQVGRAAFAATIGNMLEFYDFITYSFFAIQIGHTFFPAQSEYGSLMLSLATFGAGFVTRPIGGVVLGIFSDRVGRRPAMLLSFAMMGGAILVLALTPSYAAIGLAAPVIVIIARMVQGFALGGEVGPTTAYLMEIASPERRALVVSWQPTSQGIAATTGALVGVILKI